jgi:hypothetical protein
VGIRLIHGTEASQRAAGRVVGTAYLLTNLTAVFAAFYVREHLIVWDNAAQTAHNIVASERLFRIGIASDLFAFACDVVLAAAFYVLLKQVSMGLALTGSFFRLADSAILGGMTLTSFVALRLLSGAGYLRAFDSSQLQALARLFLGAHEAGYTIGLFFFSCGSACTSYLLLKSRYIPKALAGFGVVSSLLLLGSLFVRIIAPEVADVVGMLVFLPIFVFEIATGIWLVVKGLKFPDAAEPQAGR